MSKDAWDEGCSRGIFGLVLVILGFATLAFGGVGVWEFLVIQGLTIGVLALWAVRLWVCPKPQLLCPPIIWPVLAFALYAIGRYLTCDLEYVGRQEFLQVLVFTLLFLAVLNNLYQQDRVQTISWTLILLATAGASYAVIQYITHSNRVWNETSRDVGRATGTFLSADHFCAYLEMVLPLVLSLLLAGRIKPLTRVLLGYGLLVMLGAVPLTYSRAGWVAAVAGLLVVLLILVGHRNHRKPAGLALLLLLGGGIVFVTCFLSRTALYLRRVEDAQGKMNMDIFVRLKLWRAALRMWLDHFWWGVGPGHFDWHFNEYRPQSIQLRPGWVHCDYLNVLTDWGAVGGILVLAVLVLAVLGLLRTWPGVRRVEKDFGSGMSNRFAFCLGALGGLAALAVHSCFDFNLHVPADALLALTLLALLSSHQRFATERYWHKPRPPVRWLISLVLVAGMAYLGWQTCRQANEARWLARADELPQYSLAQARVLETAFHCEPGNFETSRNIAECYHHAVFADGETNTLEDLETALRWYRRTDQLNPGYSLNCAREGVCLELLGRPEEAWECLQRADLHDPNGYNTAANVGWYYLQQGEYAAARCWLMRSLELQPKDNVFAATCLTVVEKDLSDYAGDLR